MDDPELEAIRARKLRALESALSAVGGPTVASGAPIPLTDGGFDAEIRKPGLLLVDFWAVWCGPCHRVAPILEAIANERAETVRVGKLNVDENPRTAERFQIMSIPTMLLFKDGRLVDGIVGAVPRAQIESMIGRWT